MVTEETPVQAAAEPSAPAPDVRLLIIIPCLGREDLLRACLRALNSVPPNPRVSARVLVVAEGQDAGLREFCEERSLAYMPSEEALSFAIGNNRAVTLAHEAGWDHNWLLLINNDVAVGPTFLDGLLASIDAGMDICGAKLAYPDGKIQHFGKWFTLDFYPIHPLRGEPGDHKDTLEPRGFPDVTFACVAIKRRLWEVLGGLDEHYHNGFEDDDFCLRARILGAAIGVHPLMAGVHRESQTTGQDNENKQAQWEHFKAEWVDSGRIRWALGVFQGWRWA